MLQTRQNIFRIVPKCLNVPNVHFRHIVVRTDLFYFFFSFRLFSSFILPFSPALFSFFLILFLLFLSFLSFSPVSLDSLILSSILSSQHSRHSTLFSSASFHFCFRPQYLLYNIFNILFRSAFVDSLAFIYNPSPNGGPFCLAFHVFRVKVGFRVRVGCSVGF